MLAHGEDSSLTACLLTGSRGSLACLRALLSGSLLSRAACSGYLWLAQGPCYQVALAQRACCKLARSRGLLGLVVPVEHGGPLVVLLYRMYCYSVRSYRCTAKDFRSSFLGRYKRNLILAESTDIL